MTDAQRYKKHISKCRELPNGCIVYHGARTYAGYGRIWNGSRLVQATHFFYERYYGHVRNI